MTRLCFVGSTWGDSLTAELLSAVAAEAASLGATVTRAGGSFPSPAEPTIFVYSPSELARSGGEASRPPADHLRRSIALCQERPGTDRFEAGFRAAERAGAVLDTSAAAVVEHRRRGVPAERFQLGYTAAWDDWNARSAERGVDVLFTGRATARREAVLTTVAGDLSRFRFRVLFSPEAPRDEHGSDGPARRAGLLESRAFLLVHPDGGPYFDWPGALQAISNGAVLISEHSRDFGPLVPGEHFLSGAGPDLGLLVARMLRDEQRLTQMRMAAYEFIRAEVPMRPAVERLLAIADRLSSGDR